MHGNCTKCDSETALKRNRTLNGLTKRIYADQIGTAKRQPHKKLGYTLQEFKIWIKANHKQEFIALWRKWRDSNWDKWLRPSFDRLDNSLGYSLDNIRLVTWEDNYRKDVHRNCDIAAKAQSKEVIQMDMEGNEINRYRSAREAGRQIGVYGTAITSCCRGMAITAKGFRWRYLDGSGSQKEIEPGVSFGKSTAPKKVHQLAMDNEFIAEYGSAGKAAKATDGDAISIRSACCGKYKHSGGFKWRYANAA